MFPYTYVPNVGHFITFLNVLWENLRNCHKCTYKNVILLYFYCWTANALSMRSVLHDNTQNQTFPTGFHQYNRTTSNVKYWWMCHIVINLCLTDGAGGHQVNKTQETTAAQRPLSMFSEMPIRAIPHDISAPSLLIYAANAPQYGRSYPAS